MKWTRVKKFFEIKKELVPIRLAFLIFNFGFSLIWPFLSLQMRSLGLSYQDISLTIAFTPFITTFSTPFLGLLGDRISYKAVLIADLVVMIISSTSFLYLPKIQTFTRTPKINLVYESSAVLSVVNLTWPHLPCSSQTDINSSTCQSVIDENIELFGDIHEYLTCDSDIAQSIIKPISNFNYSVLDTKNGTMCFGFGEPVLNTPNHDRVECEIAIHGVMESCEDTIGSHALTFGLYIVARLIFDASMNSAFCLLDGAALKQAKQYKSDYALIAFFLQIGSTLGTLASGFLVDDSEAETATEVDYSKIVYVGDACYVITIVLAMFLKISMEDADKAKQSESMFKTFSKSINGCTLLLFAFTLCRGLNMGVSQSFRSVYLVEELEATPEIIGGMSSVALGVGILAAAVAKPLISFMGTFNIIYIGIFLEGIKSIITSLVKQKPPYFALYLELIAFFSGGLSQICLNSYGYQVVPSHLAGTIASMIAIVQYMIGKSLGAMYSGQLYAHTSLDIPNIFQVEAGITMALATAAFIYYWMRGRKREKHVIKSIKDQEECSKVKVSSVELECREAI